MRFCSVVVVDNVHVYSLYSHYSFRLLYCRYLWPLIHYHKFLAKCIKKLKRNGVDVKTSVSPVAVFLREEVCAVSDHLASVSLFTSEEWMDCLVHFNGWTDHSPAGGKAIAKFDFQTESSTFGRAW